MGASGLAAPDSSLNLGFFLGQTAAQIGTANYTLQSFDLTTYCAGVDPADSEFGWGADRTRSMGKSGLAFTTEVVDPVFKQNMSPGRLYVLDGSFVSAAAMRAPVPAELARPKHVDPANRNNDKASLVLLRAIRKLRFYEAEAFARRQAISLDVFVGHAPHCATGRGEKELFKGTFQT